MARAQPRHDRACTTIRRDTAQRSLMGGLASGVCRDTILYIVTGGAGLASRHSVPGAAIRHSAPCDTQGRNRGACTTRALCRDTIFVSQAGGCDTASVCAATRQGALTTRPGRGPRHDPARTMTRRCAHNLGAVGEKPGSGCAPGAPNPVLTQCTVLSHCLGALFMSTIHEVFKKKNLNKIKMKQNKLKFFVKYDLIYGINCLALPMNAWT